MPPKPSDDRIAELRRQIAAGNYETPEKLDIAVERLLHSALDNLDRNDADDEVVRRRRPK